MVIIEAVKLGLDRLSAWFFPDRCCFCGKVIEYGTELCKRCRNADVRVGSDKCFSCGRSRADCDCNGRTRFYTGVTAPFRYDGIVRKGIHNWKFCDGELSLPFFASSVADEVKRDFGDVKFDYVCRVPQTVGETDKREAYPCEELAKAVAGKLGIPMRQFVKKMRPTECQHSLPWYRKTGNVFGVFDCVNDPEIRDKVFLIVDDVKTTGATLDECAKMLRLNGAQSVYCAAIAVAARRKQKENP